MCSNEQWLGAPPGAGGALRSQGGWGSGCPPVRCVNVWWARRVKITRMVLSTGCIITQRPGPPQPLSCRRPWPWKAGGAAIDGSIASLQGLPLRGFSLAPAAIFSGLGSTAGDSLKRSRVARQEGPARGRGGCSPPQGEHRGPWASPVCGWGNHAQHCALWLSAF